jgi:hypothetical protein
VFQIGEFAQDFVEVRRAYDEWASATPSVDKTREGKILHHGTSDVTIHLPSFNSSNSEAYSTEHVLAIEKV